MASYSFLFLLFSSSLIAIISAIPTELIPRKLGDRNDPYQFILDCSGGPNFDRHCNLNCFSILCLAGPNPVQKGAAASDDNRDDSGFSTNLLRTTEATREKKGIYISEAVLREVGRSVEENNYANTEQGGEGELLGPTKEKPNKGKYTAIYRVKVANISII